MTLVDGKELDQAIQELIIKFMPTILDNFEIMVLANFFNFKYIPSQHTFSYANLIGIIW